MIRSLRVNENLHIVLWLIKDLCWLMEYRHAGLLMVAPTLVMAGYITWLSRVDRGLLVHAIAVVFWILANSTWMIGDFFFKEQGHGLARAFFLAGLLLLGIYYLVSYLLERQRGSTAVPRT